MSEVTYRKVTDDDFTQEGKGKPGLKFYESDESDESVTPKDPNNPLTEPTKDPNITYVVEVVAADGGVDGDGDAAGDAAADGPPTETATAAPAAAPDAAPDAAPAAAKDAVDTKAASQIHRDLRMVIDVVRNVRDNEPTIATVNEGIKLFCEDPDKNKMQKEAPFDLPKDVNQVEEIQGKVGDGVDTTSVQSGGRRRSKRRQPKRSAKQSKKGGRSRKSGSKNRRKQSRRRKH